MVGLGGVLVELLHAVSLRVLPITRADAEDMICLLYTSPIAENGIIVMKGCHKK